MSIDKSHPDYIDLRSRIRECPKDFIAIVGTGLSRPVGIPSWQDLRDILIRNAKSRISEILEDEREGYGAKLKRIESENDLWNAFSELQHLMLPGAYEACIKQNVTLSDRTRPPVTYELLWALGIKGIISFNIDTCAIDSFAKVKSCAVDSATGKDISRFSRFLVGTHPFVFQPHGRVDDRETWVFTNEERTRILGTEPYNDFFKALFQTKHLLIVGFDPTDFVFEYLLQRALTERTEVGAKHYILMPRTDPATARKLSEHGFAVIPYVPSDQLRHPEIKDALEDWLAFTPADTIPGSVFTGPREDPSRLPSDEDLLRLPVHKVRELLNGAVASIIPPGTIPKEGDIEKLEDFYHNHLRAIHQAWLIEPSSECDVVHGYRVTRLMGRGAFGAVYEADSLTGGERAAIKVLLPEVKHNPEYLNSFRRGVRSMRILTDRNIPRMVRLYNAYEVPACIVMECIDGLTLTEARHQKTFSSLTDYLEVLEQIGETVQRAHNLEERVLHRDLKPDNVILRDAYKKGDAIDAVVLDFDLSWHKGALELSVVHGARAQGYAAPEQTAVGRRKGVSTRHTAVDVFGYGMLAYFLFYGTDPRSNEHRFDGYEEKLREKIRTYPSSWHCLPSYLSHVIVECTRDEQSDRISFAEALTAFHEAKLMTASDIVGSTNPLVLEELAAIVAPDSTPIRKDFGRRLEVTSFDPSKQIVLEISDARSDVVIDIKLVKERAEHDHYFITNCLEKAKDKATKAINKQPLRSVHGIIGQGRLEITAQWPVSGNIKKASIEAIANLIVDALAAMSLS